MAPTSSADLDYDVSDISDLSSVPASPSPPPDFDYPSPPTPKRSHPSGQDTAPANKKRRVGPKERTTERLDLSDSATLSYSDQQPQIDLLRKTIRQHRKIVVIAGAGISTSAGIPDFRSGDGLFKSLQKKHNLRASGKLLFDAAVYQDEALTASFHDMVRSLADEAAKTTPTAFHHMLARLAQENRLTRLYTQNIDGIETSMPPLASQAPLNIKAPWPRTVQLHGSLEKMVCQKCCHMSDFQGQLFDGPDAPLCPACTETDACRATAGQRSHGVGKLRPRIVLYNEHNPDEEAITSVMNADVRSRPDALIVVGTSMKIPGVRCLVRNLCRMIRSRRNGTTIWVNNEPPTGKEFEGCWDLIVKGDCEEVARLANLKRWDDNSEGVFDVCEPEEVDRVKREQGGSPTVVVETPKKKKQQKLNMGYLTPSSSSNGEGSLAQPHKQSSSSSETRPNPASRGRSLNEVLKDNKTTTKTKKQEPKKATKKPTKKQGDKKTTTKNEKVTSFTKVTKAPKTTGGTEKSVKLEKDPMHPLPPGAARNNGPTFPNLAAKDGDDKATIQPESVPNGMKKLLDSDASR